MPALGKAAGLLPFSTHTFIKLLGTVNFLSLFFLKITFSRARYNLVLSFPAVDALLYPSVIFL